MPDHSFKSPQGVVFLMYEVWHQDQLLEANESSDILEYKLGSGVWPNLIEEKIAKAQAGEHLSINLLASDDAFGKPDPERVLQMQAQDFEYEPSPGDLITFDLPDGEQVEGQVLTIFNDQIEVDFNHPFVGRDLRFEIRVVDIKIKHSNV